MIAVISSTPPIPVATAAAFSARAAERQPPARASPTNAIVTPLPPLKLLAVRRANLGGRGTAAGVCGSRGPDCSPAPGRGGGREKGA